jgi:hypothetical protein
MFLLQQPAQSSISIWLHSEQTFFLSVQNDKLSQTPKSVMVIYA